MKHYQRWNEKSWISQDNKFVIKVWLSHKGEINGEIFEKAIGKTHSLAYALSTDSDYAYFPKEVSENLHRLLADLKRT